MDFLDSIFSTSMSNSMANNMFEPLYTAKPSMPMPMPMTTQSIEYNAPMSIFDDLDEDELSFDLPFASTPSLTLIDPDTIPDVPSLGSMLPGGDSLFALAESGLEAQTSTAPLPRSPTPAPSSSVLGKRSRSPDFSLDTFSLSPSPIGDDIADSLEDPNCALCGSSSRGHHDCRRRKTGYSFGWRRFTVRLSDGRVLTKKVICTPCLQRAVRVGTAQDYTGSLTAEGKGVVANRPVYDPNADTVHSAAAAAYHVYADACDEAHANGYGASAFDCALDVLVGRLADIGATAGKEHMVLPVFFTTQKKDGSPPALFFRKYDAQRKMFVRRRKQTTRSPYKKRKPLS